MNGVAKAATSMQEITASHMYIYQPEGLNISLILFVMGRLVGFPFTVQFSCEWSSEGCYQHTGDNG